MNDMPHFCLVRKQQTAKYSAGCQNPGMQCDTDNDQEYSAKTPVMWSLWYNGQLSRYLYRAGQHQPVFLKNYIFRNSCNENELRNAVDGLQSENEKA
jgi:hypothetical protein